jgi:DNA-binding response OmpR family regulator
MRILIIEDDATLRQLLETFLTWKGYEMVAAGDGPSGLRSVETVPPDLIVLDVMMPGMDGYEVCRTIRKHSSVPILMLTAKGTQDDIVKGLECGADDYVKKPFDLRELELRIKALVKRTSAHKNGSSDIFDDGRLHINLQQGAVSFKGRTVHLTHTEFRLLGYLLKHRDRAVPHDELLREVWGSQYLEDVANLQVYIRYLREKLEEDPGKPSYICTRRGVGYCFGAAH